jgi:putative cardiolipin synthase
MVGCASVACASVDFDQTNPHSSAIDGSDTRLGRQFAEYGADHPGESGFYPLLDGIEALGARIAIAERSERTLDAQYYFILDDPIGSLFVGKLLEAADRGVRVRLLVDDIATKGYELSMGALHAHPNFEIRVFNPFARRNARALGFVTDFSRLNRRMHNKSFTADGSITIVGGRNIGAEYFEARSDQTFGDIDVLGFGQVARDVSTAFDAYWNSGLAIPADRLVETVDNPDAEIEAQRNRYAALEEEIRDSRYGKAVRHVIIERLTENPQALFWARYAVVWDPPQKALAGVSRADTISGALSRAIERAEKNLFVISAYFVPMKAGVAFFGELRDRGVSVQILTNSLAATDVVAVHAGYAPYRKALLEIGVELFEMRPDYRFDGPARRSEPASSRTSLHGKAFTIDDQQVFIGSFNWDPRSLDINTEMGILIHSPELAADVSGSVKGAFPEVAYQVVLSDRGQLRWVSREGDEVVVFSREPQASIWRRLAANILRLFPIRRQL